MAKRDTYRDEPDWETVDQAYEEWAKECDTRDLMMPGDYERTKKCHGRTRHY